MKILVADDDSAIRQTCRAILEKLGEEIYECGELASVFPALQKYQPEILLLDLSFPDGNALPVIPSLVQNFGEKTIIIVLTAEIETSIVVQAIQAGAFHYITKPFSIKNLTFILSKARRDKEARTSPAAGEFNRNEESPGFVAGVSPQMHKLLDIVKLLAQNDSTTVLIQGESGTGKELIAQYLHSQSPRSNEPFIPINCPAIPEQLVESELFGHARGAFTDAKAVFRGLFEAANGGTLFLDEIGEMPLGIQSKLLRFLETRRIRPVGSDHDIVLDVRILAATNRDLREEVKNGRFRLDLFYRIGVVTLKIPPLRERQDDILILANHYLVHYARLLKRGILPISPAAISAMNRYSWPGNIRELKNIIEHMTLFASGSFLELEDLPLEIRGDSPVRPATAPPPPAAKEFLPEPLEDIELRYIEKVYHHCRGNKNETARVLKIARQTLLTKLRKIESIPPGGLSEEDDEEISE